MTATEQLKLEERENNTFNYVKGLIQNGISPEIIAQSFDISIQKTEEIIRRIKNIGN